MNGHEVCIADLGPLTPREAEALLWVAEGKTAWEAGTILGITEATTNSHIASAAQKLKATNRAHLITRAFVLGVLAVTARFVIFTVVILQAAGGNIDAVRSPRVAYRWRRDPDAIEAPRLNV